MSLPDSVLSTTPVLAEPLYPDSFERTDPTQDWEMGGIALNDASMGNLVQPWRVWTDGTNVWVGATEIPGDQHLILTDTGITEVSLGFDQLMQATVVYVANGLCKLRWFDSTVSTFVTTSYAGVYSPMLTLDDKRTLHTGTSDIIFIYVRNKKLYYRQQRDRYGVEHYMRDLPSNAVRIMSFGLTVNNRLQVKLKYPYTAAVVDLLTDQMYTLSATDVVPMFTGDVQAGRWRSRVFVADDQPIMAWARIEGDYPATLRLIGDDKPMHTVVVTGPSAFRLPAGRYREWQLEIESAGRITGVYMASSAAELEDGDDASLEI